MIETPGIVEKIDRKTLKRSVKQVLRSQGKKLSCYHKVAIDVALAYWAAHADYSLSDFNIDPQYFWDGAVCLEVLEHTKRNSLAFEIATMEGISTMAMNIWITNHGWRLK